ncbi:MAG: tyrosine-type recombinase/integrase [Alphaproteobacteria bacterium]|nr:tyrosine-type recombinase/integrase [Alphaproteobacteria bacterium]
MEDRYNAPAPLATAERPLTAIIDSATRERLDSALAASKAPATRKAYRAAWEAWTAWAGEHRASPLPAAPEAVAHYLAARAATAGMATLRMATAAIAAAHDLAGHSNPCADRVVRTAMAGFARQAADAGHVARQAQGLTAERVAAIRGALNGHADACPRAARDMALVSVMADGGLRRSEAAALEWRDIEREADGSGRLTVRRSKTDQNAEGAVVAVTPAAMEDLDRLASMRGECEAAAPVFGVSDRQIARRIAAAAKAAGLGDGYSGHSGRVGMAQRMTRNGAPAAAVMRQGRWQSPAMVARYTRNESAGEALRYL